MKIHVIVAIACGAALSVAGCTPSGGDGTSSADPVPTATVTVTVTPSPSPEAPPPAPAAIPDFDFTSYEGAQIGSTWSQMSTQIGLAVGGSYGCPWYGPLRETELIMTYAFVDASDPAGGGSTFFYTLVGDPSTSGPFPRNAEGVGVGSTKAEVLAAYPGAVIGTFDDLGAGMLTTITVDDSASTSRYVFAISGNSVDGNVVDLLQWGSPDAGLQWGHLCSGF